MTATIVREVLRGMEVEDGCVRLRRVSRVGLDAEAAIPLPSAGEAERLRGYEEGLSLGRAEGLRSGREEGLASGHKEAASREAAAVDDAVAQATRELVATRSHLAKIVTKMESGVADTLAIAEEELVAVCFDALCRVVGATALDSSAVVQQVKEVLAGARGLHDLVALRMHPDDVRIVREAGCMPRDIECIPDADVEVGGCIVTGRRGSLDLRLETMLSGLRIALLHARAARQLGGSR